MTTQNDFAVNTKTNPYDYGRESGNKKVKDILSGLYDIFNTVRNSPMNQDIEAVTSHAAKGGPSVMAKAATTLGVGGAALTDTATKAINYILGSGKTNLLDPNIAAFKQAWGIGDQPQNTPAQAQAPPAAAPPAAITPSREAVPNAPRGWSPAQVAGGINRSQPQGDLYDVLKKATPAELKRFIDEHPNIPGLGYITDDKGNVTRTTVERPQKEAEQGMTVNQAKALYPILSTISHDKYYKGMVDYHNKNLDVTKSNNSDIKEAALEQKKDAEFETMLSRNSVKKTNEAGDVASDYRPWLIEQAFSNPGRIRGQYKEEATNLKNDAMSYIERAYKANPKLAKTPENSRSLLKEYMKKF